MKTYSAADRATLSSRVITDEGYMVAPALLARPGVQAYAPEELGLAADEFPGKRIIHLLRPDEEVFHPDSVASFEGKPVTVGHPKGNRVTAKTWRDVAVGDAHRIKRDGDHLAGELVVRDPAAVQAIAGGKTAISNGYDFRLEKTSGVTADGKSYDGIMRHIRGNHVAIVDMARGGPTLRIGDDDNERTNDMSVRRLKIGDAAFDIPADSAGPVELAIERMAKDHADVLTAKDAAVADATAQKTRADKAEAEVASLKETATKTAADHAAALASLEKQILKPEQLEALVTERTRVVGDAAKIAPGLKPEGKTVAQIRLAAIGAVMTAGDSPMKTVATAVLGADAAKLASEADKIDAAKVASAFDAAVAAKGAATATAGDGFRSIGADIVSSGTPTVDKPVGRGAFLDKLQSAHLAKPVAADASK